MTAGGSAPAAWTEHRFLSFDATPIFYLRLKPASEPKAVVILVHGLGEHAGRYRLTAEYFSGVGCDVWAADLRGFGKSGGRRASIRAFTDYHEDLLALHRLASSETKGSPVFLLGHSLGGLIASSYIAFAQHPPLSGLVLSSPFFGTGFRVPFWRHFLAVLLSYMVPDFTQDSGLNPDVMTHDKQVVEAYKNDPLVCRRISLRLYREMMSMIREKERIAGGLDSSVLIVQSGRDLIVSKDAVLSFYGGLKSSSKELKVYKGFYHEVLNELDRAAVLTDIGAWVEKRIKQI